MLSILISQMREMQEGLEEVYFEYAQSSDPTREDIAKRGQIIGSLLCFGPSARASAKQDLDDTWFNE